MPLCYTAILDRGVTLMHAYGLLWLEPIEGGCEGEDAHEAGGGLFVAGRNRAPLLQPRPQPLDHVAVVVHPVGTGDGLLVALGRNGRAGPSLPDVLPEGLTAEAPVSHHPRRHSRQALQKGGRVGEFMSLPGSQ